MLVVFGSARSSPGVTTAALAVAGCLDGSVVVEGDPDGGVIAARYGLPREPGLVTLAASVRAGTSQPRDINEHCQLLPGGQPVVVGPASVESATAVWKSSGPRLSSALSGAASTETVVVDGGRLSPAAPTLPLLEVADLLIVVVRPILEDLHALSGRTRSLGSQTNRLAVVIVGDKPYGPAEVAEHLGVEVLGALATDPRAAGAFAGQVAAPRGLRRSALARSARGIAERLVEVRPTPEEANDSVRSGARR